MRNSVSGTMPWASDPNHNDRIQMGRRLARTGPAHLAAPTREAPPERRPETRSTSCEIYHSPLSPPISISPRTEITRRRLPRKNAQYIPNPALALRDPPINPLTQGVLPRLHGDIRMGSHIAKKACLCEIPNVSTPSTSIRSFIQGMSVAATCSDDSTAELN